MKETGFSKLVKQLRQARRLTQEQLARELDVTVGTVDGWENERHRLVNAQRTRLRKMAEANGLVIPTMKDGA